MEIEFISNSIKFNISIDEIEHVFLKNKMDFIENTIYSIIRYIQNKYEKYENTKFYKVGGSNRDIFLGIESKDFDIVITHVENVSDDEYFTSFHKFMEIFKSFGDVSNNNPEKEKNDYGDTKFITYKFVPKIIDKDNNDVTKIIFNKHKMEPIDIVSARTEVLTHKVGYHESFVPKYSNNITIQDDLDRRDFIINAIAKEIGKDKYFFPHEYDIKTINHVFSEKVLVAVNLENLIFDPTRMLRAIQLCGRLDFELEEYTYKIIKKYSHFVKHLKMEKVEKEMIKMCEKSVNLKQALFYFIDSGLFHVIFDAKNDLNINDNFCYHLNLDNLIDEFHHYPHLRNKIKISFEDCQKNMITDLFKKLFGNNDIFNIYKEAKFGFIIGLLGFLSIYENRDLRKREDVIKIIQNNITKNTDNISIINSVIELCEIIFIDDFENNHNKSQEYIQNKISSIETFMSFVNGNDKLKIHMNLYLQLIKLYNKELFENINNYTIFVHNLTKSIQNDEIVDVNSEKKYISNICIYISEQHVFLNRKEIFNTVKKILFMYPKYVHPHKIQLSDFQIIKYKKDKILDLIIKNKLNIVLANISKDNVMHLIHNIVKEVVKMFI